MSNSGYCSLIISGDNLDLIEKTLKIPASEKNKKGEVINSVIGESQRKHVQRSFYDCNKLSELG